jgi:hypothetical protein
MLKLGSQTIGELVLDMDFGHFTDQDAHLHEFVYAMAELLSLNKKVSSKGDWYERAKGSHCLRVMLIVSSFDLTGMQTCRLVTRKGSKTSPNGNMSRSARPLTEPNHPEMKIYRFKMRR